MTRVAIICPALALLCLPMATACAPAGSYIWVDDVQTETAETPQVRIEPGDQLEITVWNQEQMSGEFVVREDGRVTIPLVGEIAAGGLTPEGTAQEITRRLDGLINNPKVSVALVASPSQTVSLLGEVREPGRYEIDRGDGVLEILARGRGLSQFARHDAVFVLRRKEGRLVRIRFDYDRLQRGDGRGVDFDLRDGDVVIVE